MHKYELLDDLLDRSTRFSSAVDKLVGELDPEQLLRNPAPDAWCVAQVLEHLVLSHGGYLKAADKKLAEVPVRAEDMEYSPGMLGGLMTRTLTPTAEGKVKAAPAPKSMVPSSHIADFSEVYRAFTGLQGQLVNILERSRNYDINRVRLPLSIFPIISLRLGDVLQVITVHNERHLLQLERIKNSVK